MSSITDTPPPHVQSELDGLKRALDRTVPGKRGDNLLIATWNIRVFSSLTRKWTAGSADSPKRDLRGLRAIIEILSRFDVVAIQELKGDLRAMRDTMRFLGDDWAFLMTDVTLGDRGGDERLAFLFNRKRVKPSGLAAELVVPPERLREDGMDEGTLRRQFARTPYAVSFQRKGCTFILVTLHVLYGEQPQHRTPELNGIAEWMRDWASRSNRYHHNLLTLGDFNVDRRDSPLYEAFTSTGLTVPDPLLNLPRTIFDDPEQPSRASFYDQIAWFTTRSHALIDLKLRDGGSFDFLPWMYRDMDLSRQSLSFRLSDHYPLWVEFGMD